MSRTEPRLSLWFSPMTAHDDYINVQIYDEHEREYVMNACTPREAAFVMDALDAMGIKFGHVATRSCFCEHQYPNTPIGATCGDCWRDYNFEGETK